ncbi:hypothetical protein OH77DRAFT_1298 [Trametes cingulata]|nr:hypothetical protein OH77DRAFT_1298 [Trametes cingulata]
MRRSASSLLRAKERRYAIQFSLVLRALPSNRRPRSGGQTSGCLRMMIVVSFVLRVAAAVVREKPCTVPAGQGRSRGYAGRASAVAPAWYTVLCSPIPATPRSLAPPSASDSPLDSSTSTLAGLPCSTQLLSRMDYFPYNGYRARLWGIWAWILERK